MEVLKSCVLCVKIMDSDYQILDQLLIEMLEVLLINLNLANTEPFTCDICIEKIKSAFGFKTSCIETMDCLLPYIGSDGKLQVDLKTIYLKERSEEGLEIDEEMEVCRLCMKLCVRNTGMMLLTILEELHFLENFEKYIPEVALKSTETPFICATCLISLQHFSDLIFLVSCRPSEEHDIDDTEIITSESDNRWDTILVETVKENGNANLNQTEQENQRVDVDEANKAEIIVIDDNEEHEVVLNSFLFDDPGRNLEPTLQRDNISSDHSVPPTLPEIVKYKCDICLFGTDDINDFNEHEESHYLNESMKDLNCKFCTFNTQYVYQFIRHVLSHRLDENYYKCKTCHYKTKYKDVLKMHQLNRHPIKFLKCKYCDFQVQSKYVYDKHINLCHLKTQTKMYDCLHCSYRTPKREKFYRHIRVNHQVFKCSDCDYVSSKSFYFKKHTAGHKKGLIFLHKCTSCTYETDAACILKCHSKIHEHSRNMEYKCEKCPFITQVHKSLNIHMATH